MTLAYRRLIMTLRAAYVVIICASAASAVMAADISSQSQRSASHQPLAPTSTYSVQAVGELFSRPENIQELLRNLKLAFDVDLLLQPNLYNSTNLLSFFDGASVRAKKTHFSAPSPPYMNRGHDYTIGLAAPWWDTSRVTLKYAESLEKNRFAHGTKYWRRSGLVEIQLDPRLGITPTDIERVFGPPASKVSTDVGGKPEAGFDYVISGDIPSLRRHGIQIKDAGFSINLQGVVTRARIFEVQG